MLSKLLFWGLVLVLGTRKILIILINMTFLDCQMCRFKSLSFLPIKLLQLVTSSKTSRCMCFFRNIFSSWVCVCAWNEGGWFIFSGWDILLSESGVCDDAYKSFTYLSLQLLPNKKSIPEIEDEFWHCWFFRLLKTSTLKKR